MIGLPFIKSFLESEVREIDGYKYRFENVQENPEIEDTVIFDVYCNLPKKGQSYTLSKLYEDIKQIVIEASNYYGQILTYSPRVLVNNKDFLGGRSSIYVTPQKKEEVIKTLNNKFPQVSFTEEETGDVYSMRIYFLSPERFEQKMFEQRDENDEIDFNCFYKVFDIKRKNKNTGLTENLKPNPYKIDELASTINNYLLEGFGDDGSLSDVVYSVMEDELKIHNTDIYINSNFYIYQIDGEEVKVKGYHPNFQDYMFIS